MVLPQPRHEIGLWCAIVAGVCMFYPLPYIQSVPRSTCLSAHPRQLVLLQFIVEASVYCVSLIRWPHLNVLSPVYNTQMLSHQFYLQMQMPDQQSSVHQDLLALFTYNNFDPTKLTRNAEKTSTNGLLTYSTSIQNKQWNNSSGNSEYKQSRPFSIIKNIADAIAIAIVSPLSLVEGRKKKYRTGRK